MYYIDVTYIFILHFGGVLSIHPLLFMFGVCTVSVVCMTE